MADTTRRGPSHGTNIYMILRGRQGNIPQGKHAGAIGVEIENNKGVFQGSPIIALLYITFADGIMDEYKTATQLHNAQKIKMITRNLQVAFNGTKHIDAPIHHKTQDEKPKWKTHNPENNTTINEDEILAPCDTCVTSNHINDIPPKLRSYYRVARSNHLLVNWDNVFILANGKLKAQNAANAAPHMTRSNASQKVKYLDTWWNLTIK